MSGKQLVDSLAEQWGKILAVVMLKLNAMDITLTPQDIERLNDPAGLPWAKAVIEVQKHKDGFGHS